MTTASTAFVMLGPSGVGSFHDRLWRVSPNTAQLVEGGTNGPYFLLGSSSDEHIIRIEDWDADFVARALLLLVAVLSEDEESLAMLRSTENLVRTDRGERIAPYWDIDDSLAAALSKRLSRICRIGLVRLEARSTISSRNVQALRDFGFDVTSYQEHSEWL